MSALVLKSNPSLFFQFPTSYPTEYPTEVRLRLMAHSIGCLSLYQNLTLRFFKFPTSYPTSYPTRIPTMSPTFITPVSEATLYRFHYYPFKPLLFTSTLTLVPNESTHTVPHYEPDIRDGCKSSWHNPSHRLSCQPHPTLHSSQHNSRPVTQPGSLR